jgi:hypothetical protein
MQDIHQIVRARAQVPAVGRFDGMRDHDATELPTRRASGPG